MSPRAKGGPVIATVLLGGVLTILQCNLLTNFEDCTHDSDCNLGERCNTARHFCAVPEAPTCDASNAGSDFGVCEVPMAQRAGPCRDGRLICGASGAVTCVQRTQPAPAEVCNNGLDDDCNGLVDDGPTCTVNFPMTTGLVVGSDDPSVGDGDDAPAHTVCLDAYTLDDYEVTFQAFSVYLSSLDQSNFRVAAPSAPLNTTVAYGQYLIYNDSGTDVPMVLVSNPPDNLALRETPYGFTPFDAAAPMLPIVNVTWFAADRYCRWAGKHLPTEAEWFRAARGVDGTRPYPWGSQAPTCALANVGSGGPNGGPCVGNPWPVGSSTAGTTPEGVYDLYGNANEWMWDYLDDNAAHSANVYYQSHPADGGAWCQDEPHGPLGPAMGAPINEPEDAGLYCVACRFARGRHYRTVDLRIGIRRWLDADRAEPYVGFRCSQGGASR